MSENQHWNLSTVTSLECVKVVLDEAPTYHANDEDGTINVVYSVQVVDSKGNQLHELFIKAHNIEVTTLNQ